MSDQAAKYLCAVLGREARRELPGTVLGVAVKRELLNRRDTKVTVLTIRVKDHAIFETARRIPYAYDNLGDVRFGDLLTEVETVVRDFKEYLTECRT